MENFIRTVIAHIAGELSSRVAKFHRRISGLEQVHEILIAIPLGFAKSHLIQIFSNGSCPDCGHQHCLSLDAKIRRKKTKRYKEFCVAGEESENRCDCGLTFSPDKVIHSNDSGLYASGTFEISALVQ